MDKSGEACELTALNAAAAGVSDRLHIRCDDVTSGEPIRTVLSPVSCGLVWGQIHIIIFNYLLLVNSNESSFQLEHSIVVVAVSPMR